MVFYKLKDISVRNNQNIFYPWAKEQLQDDEKYYFLLDDLKINDSFKKIIITSNTLKPFYNDQGIWIMKVYDFLLNVESLEL